MTGGRFIEPKELESLMPNVQKGECLLLDVRSTTEFRSGHIRHALSMPVEEIGKRSNELGNEKILVIYCRSGKRSLRALSLLNEIGHGDILILEGGLERWSGDLVTE